jgi:hypothetical protein
MLNPAILDYLKNTLKTNPLMYSQSINILIPQLLPQDIDSVVDLIGHGLILKPLIRPKVYSIIKSLENPSEIVRNSEIYMSIQKEIQQAKEAVENLQKNIKDYHNMISAWIHITSYRRYRRRCNNDIFMVSTNELHRSKS